MLSFAEYAEQQRISYEAVRQQVARYQDVLEAHIIRKGRRRLLDDEAIEFLNRHRQEALGLGPNISIVNVQLQKDLETANRENMDLLREISTLKDTIIHLTSELSEKNLLLAANQEEQQKYLQAVAETDSLKEELAAQKEELAAQRAQNADTAAELDQTREQLLDEKRRSEDVQTEYMEANRQLEQERTRRITFREWWARRK